MDLLQLEIFIPKESEVKKIPVWTLPKSVIRRMSLPLPAAVGSKSPVDLPECIWISPAIIRRRDQKNSEPNEPITSLLHREFQVSQGPLQMSIVSPNRPAYQLLQDIMPGNKLSTHTSRSALLPHGLPPKTNQDGIIVYQGLIYLIARNPKRCRSQFETSEPRLTSPSSFQSSSAVSSSAVSDNNLQQDSLEPANKQKKSMCVTLPQVFLKPDGITKTGNMSVTDQDLINKNNQLIRPAAGSQHLTRCRTPGDQQEVSNADLSEHEPLVVAESSHQHSDPDTNLQIDYHHGDHSWTQDDPQTAASCPSPQQLCDFKELERQERIAGLKAKWRQKKADLHSNVK